MTRVLLVGYDPSTVDYSDPALPPGMSAEKIHAGIAHVLRQLRDRGWEADDCFILPDGTVANLKNFMPGGITVYVIGELGSFVTDSAGKPQVTNLTTSTGPLTLGSCAVMSPFSGSGTNPGNDVSKRYGHSDKPGDTQ